MFESESPRQHKKRLNNEKQAKYRKRQKAKHDSNIKRHELGRMDQICVHCDAKFWIE